MTAVRATSGREGSERVGAPVAAVSRCTIRPASGLIPPPWDGTPAHSSGAGPLTAAADVGIGGAL